VCVVSSARVAIANVLRTSVELNRDCLDPSTGFTTTLAALIVSGGRLVVVEISWLSAAGRAAHAGIVLMHSNRSSWIQVDKWRESEMKGDCCTEGNLNLKA
jgi:hypothetical protein